MLTDVEQRLIFPPEIATSNLRPEIVLWSRSACIVHLVELTVPWEDAVDEAYERKKLRYSEIAAEAEQRGWKVQVYPVEPERPTPAWGEPERPQPKRGESVRPQPKEGGVGASIAQEGEGGACRALGPKLPAEGECLLVPPPPAEECLLVSLPPPAEDECLLVTLPSTSPTSTYPCKGGRQATVPCKKGRAAPVPCKRGRAGPVPCKRRRLHAAPTFIARRPHAAPTSTASAPRARRGGVTGSTP
ncbi:UNVERIFIED_CONTAM: hypothetical protein FKN15_050191 [Acipenser sinensis]